MKNYFQVLGLEEGATLDEIKAAYRIYAKNFHPDKQNGNEFFKERFQEIQEAYEYLCQNYNNDNETTNNDESNNPNENEVYEEDITEEAFVEYFAQQEMVQDAQLLTFSIELQNEGNYVLPNDCITIKYSILHCTYTQLIIEDAEHMWQLDMPVCNYENIYYLNLYKYEIKGNIKLKIKYGNSQYNSESKKIIDVFIATNYNLQEANKYAYKFSSIDGYIMSIPLIIFGLPFCLMLVVAVFSIWIDTTDFIDLIDFTDFIIKLKWYHWVGCVIFGIIVSELLVPSIENKRRISYNRSFRKRNQPPK